MADNTDECTCRWYNSSRLMLGLKKSFGDHRVIFVLMDGTDIRIRVREKLFV